MERTDGVRATTVTRDRGFSAQALVLLPSASAASEIIFDIGGTISIEQIPATEASDDGFPATAASELWWVTDDTGKRWMVGPAWAKDANGISVPTRYEIRNGTIVQIVDHTGQTYAYPIVADPFLGQALFNRMVRGTYRGDYRYSGWVTVFGAAVLNGGMTPGGVAAGGSIFLNNGWAEWKAKFGTTAMTNKTTLIQQYRCHTLAGAPGLFFTADWGLERYRVNKTNWGVGLASHKCNWDS